MDIFAQSFYWWNIPFTTIFIIMLIFWLTMLLGFFDIEIFDFEIEIDGFFGFLNLGQMPFSIWLTLFSFQMWIYSNIFHSFLLKRGWLTNNGFRFFIGIIILIPIALFLNKLITTPLKKIFEGELVFKKKDFIGKECLITSLKVDKDFGTAEIRISGDIHILDVRATPEEEISKGETLLIFDYDESEDVFWVSRI